MNTVQVWPGLTASDLTYLAADRSIDVLEWRSGKYAIPMTTINSSRADRPQVWRPAPGATVTLGGNPSGDGQFYFGLGGIASGYILEDFIFDGWAINQTGLNWIGNAHDLTFNRITVRNSAGTVNAATAWAFYVSTNNNVGATNIHFRGLTITPSGTRGMSGVQVTGGGAGPLHGHICLRSSTITNAGYAFYDVSNTADLQLNDVKVVNCGITTYAAIAVYFETAKGAYRNVVTSGGSGRIENVTPGGAMVNAGGNV